MNAIKHLWARFAGMFRAGWSRDGEYFTISAFHLGVRWWKTRSPRLDLILWWPKVRVIKGRIRKEP